MTKSILTVDDSRTMLNMLDRALSDAGYTVTQAMDGLKGLEALEGRTFDVIITDINMPNMDGFEFMEALRQKPEHMSTPILVLTTETDGPKKQRARDAGATGWLVKPFDPEKLISVIERVSG